MNYPGHISFSALKHFKVSPRHYLAYLNRDKSPTDAMLLGTYVHAKILNQDTIAVAPEVDRRTKAGKEAYEQFTISSEGKTVVPYSTSVTGDKMVERLRIEAPEWLELQAEEVKLEWQHPSGLTVLSYVDGVGPNFFLELKTTKDANPRSFERTIFYDSYIHQVALYHKGLHECTGENIPCTLLAVENHSPYGVTPFRIDREKLDFFYREVNLWINEFAAWLDDPKEVSYKYWEWEGYYNYDFKC